MDRKTNKALITIAEKVLKDTKEKSYSLFKKKGVNDEILESYNGQVAALAVSILMTGLKPTLAIYYQDAPGVENGSPDKAYRKYVLEIIVKMLKAYKNYEYENAKELVRKALAMDDDSKLKTDIINCSVALKQVVRTYNLV